LEQVHGFKAISLPCHVLPQINYNLDSVDDGDETRETFIAFASRGSNIEKKEYFF